MRVLAIVLGVIDLALIAVAVVTRSRDPLLVGVVVVLAILTLMLGRRYGPGLR